MTLALALVVTTPFCGPLSQAQAGEKLKISGEKTRIHPSQDKKNTTSFENSLVNSSFQTPNDSSSTARPRLNSTPRNPKLDRKAQNQRDERQNWALLSPGQLQDESEEEQINFGLREVGTEKSGGDGQSRSRDYTFYGLDKGFNKHGDPNGPRSSQTDRDATGARLNNSPSQTSKGHGDASEEDAPMRLNVFESGSKDGSPALGSHINSTLNIRSLLNPEVSSGGYTAPGESIDVSLRTLLGTPSQLYQTKQQDQRMESFRKLLNPNQENNGKFAGVGDPINRSPDRTSQPLNPVEGSALGVPTANLLKDALQPPSAIATPSRGLLPPLAPGYSQQTISGFSSLPSPALPRPEPISDLRSAPIGRSPTRRP